MEFNRVTSQGILHILQASTGLTSGQAHAFYDAQSKSMKEHTKNAISYATEARHGYIVKKSGKITSPSQKWVGESACRPTATQALAKQGDQSCRNYQTGYLQVN